MATPMDVRPEPTPDDVEKALTAFHRGSTAEFEELLGESGQGGPSVVKLLRTLIDRESGRDMRNHEQWSS